MGNRPFTFFRYFYNFLGYRLLVIFFLSFAVGLLDGLGLALFIPLLKLVSVKDADKNTGEGFITDLVSGFLGIEINLLNILFLILFFFSLKGLFKFIEGLVRVYYQQYFIRKIRLTNIDLLNNLSFLAFAKTDAGEIHNTLSGEVGRVNSAFRLYFKSFQSGTLVIVYVLFAFYTDPVFSLIVALGGMATNFLFTTLYKRTKYFSRRLTGESHLFEGFIIQKVSFFRYLKTTGLNEFYSQKLKNNIRTIERLQLRLGMVESLLGALREPLVIFVVVFAIFLQVKFFGQDLAIILLSLLLLYRAMIFFMAMQEQWNMFLGYSGSLENMENFTLNMERNRESEKGKVFSSFREDLVLKNVFFTYGRDYILHEINLQIDKNETVAFIGESGSGKTTLVSILAGLLTPSRGTYEIDGVNINTINRASFRSRIGYIPQDPPVFNDSVFNNVTFWAEKNSQNLFRFQKALKDAAIFDYVMELPNQEETRIGNNGIELSGGQRQRISIARELFKNVDLLIMDEATSALDSETENVIRANLEKLKGKLTIILIAHRLSTVKYADRIFVLRKGRIESEGNYKQLIERSDYFKGMINFQNL